MTETFTIEPPVFDAATGIASFTYGLDTKHFTEILTFPPNGSVEAAGSPAFAKLLDLTAIVLGVSYFKLRAPLTIATPLPLTTEERAFALDVYENGLGEFYARNNLKRFGLIRIEAPDDVRPAPAAPALSATTTSSE